MKWLLLLLLGVSISLGCERSSQENTVIVYTALDRNFSEPILKKFEERTGIRVNVKYDTESTKSVGLTAALMEERLHPRCDVFWNNEIVNTIRLKKAGILAQYRPKEAEYIPPQFVDHEGFWTGFAARARVLLVNTRNVKKEDFPRSIHDLLDARWRGKAGIARPVAGTTATHVACLFAVLGEQESKRFLEALKANQVSFESGNKSCAEKVGSGELHIALTDTDDAMIEIIEGKPVEMVYLDTDENGMGTLFIPNTLALIMNSPHPENGKRLIEFLLSPETEQALALGSSAQIPLNQKCKVAAKIKTPWQIKAMKVDFEKASFEWEKMKAFMLRFLE